MAVALVLVAVSIVYVVQALRGHDLSVYKTPRAAAAIVLAALLWACNVPLLAWAWHVMLTGLGTHKTGRELCGILGISQLGKYVPGHIAQYLGRVGMSLARGIPARAVAATMVLESLLLVAAAVMVGVGAGALSGVGLQAVRDHSMQLTLIGTLVTIAIVGLFVFRKYAPALLRRFAPKYAPSLDGTLLPSYTSLAYAFGIYCVVNFAIGVSLALLAVILLPDMPHDYWLLIAAFALAWVIGFVTPGSPAGLGIRDGLLLLMLTPIYAATPASVLVIALRIATTLGDLFDLALGVLLLRRHRTPATTTSP